MRRLILGVLVLAVGCESEQRTRLRLDVPPTARGEIRRIEVLLVNDGSDACGMLNRWGIGSCGAPCDPSERAAALPADPAQRIDVLPDDGVFGVPELDIEVEGPLEVFVIGHFENGESIYGCRGLTRGETIDLPMWWPWCTAKACERAFHPDCKAQVVCGSASTLTDPVDVECDPAVPFVEVWEQEGADCPDVPVNLERCRPARFACEAGSLEPTEDGICPDETANEMCVTDSATFMSVMDLDCDGAHPLCDVDECRDGAACGEDACVGSIRCGTDGRATCVFSGEEVCNGVDDDCDRVTDEADAVAAACNARRAPLAPAADGCAGAAGCTCGDGAACTDVGSACCRGSCVELATNTMHCGFCGNECSGDRRCIGGRCADRDLMDGGVSADAFVPECFERDDCNLTHDGAADACEDGTCMCGSGDDCTFPQICCEGRCVNPLDDLTNCGRCGRRCTICDRGRCDP